MSLINFLKTVDKLACVQRFSQCYLSKPESVLEHTGQISLLSFYIAQIINKADPKNNINIGLLLSKAIIHDFDEIITGDIANPIKYDNQKLTRLIKEMEDKNINKIQTKLEIDWLYKIWKESKSGPEGSIIALSDIICALAKFHCEICERSNFTMKSYISDRIMIAIAKKIEVVKLHYSNCDDLLTNIYIDCANLFNEIMEKS